MLIEVGVNRRSLISA